MPRDFVTESTGVQINKLMANWEASLKKRSKQAALLSVAIPLAACSDDGDDDYFDDADGRPGSGTGGAGGGVAQGDTADSNTNTNNITTGGTTVTTGPTNVTVNVEGNNEEFAALVSALITSQQNLLNALAGEEGVLTEQAKTLADLLDYLNGDDVDGAGGFLDLLSGIQTAIDDVESQLFALTGQLGTMNAQQLAFFGELVSLVGDLNRILDEETNVLRGAIENGAGSGDDGDLFILTAGGDSIPRYLGTVNDDAYYAPLVTHPTLLGPMVASSLNGPDYLDGGAGRDTLYAVTNMYTGMVTGVSPVIQNIEVIKITTELVDNGESAIPFGIDPDYAQYSVYDFTKVSGLLEIWSSNADGQSVSDASDQDSYITTDLKVYNIQDAVLMFVENAAPGHDFSIEYDRGVITGTAFDQKISLVGNNGTRDGVFGDFVEIDADDVDELGVIHSFSITADASKWNWIELDQDSDETAHEITVVDTDTSALDDTHVPGSQNLWLRVSEMDDLESIDTSGYSGGVKVELSWSVVDPEDSDFQIGVGSGHSSNSDGVDILTGSGDDIIVGSYGSDTITGGQGADLMMGQAPVVGEGENRSDELTADTYVFAEGDTVMWTAVTNGVYTFGNGADVIRNFNDADDPNIYNSGDYAAINGNVYDSVRIWDGDSAEGLISGEDFGDGNVFTIGQDLDGIFDDDNGPGATNYVVQGTWNHVAGTFDEGNVDGTDIDYMFVSVLGNTLEVLIIDNDLYSPQS